MKRMACLTALLTISWATGCVERRFIINTVPSGALVYHNGKYLGATPVDGYFVYYGKQQFRLVKEGYETLDIVQPYDPPWFEWPGIDFLTENIYPFKLRDVRRFEFAMRPLQSIPPDDIRQRAEQLRMRGQNIGTPLPPRPLLPAVPPPPPGAILGGPTPEGTLPTPRPLPAPPPQSPSVNGPGS